MEHRESKLDCKFEFWVDSKPQTLTKQFDGVLHLYEHQYDDDTYFWYGVADICCTYNDFNALKQVGMPTEFAINVRLSDGRVGASRDINSRFESNLESQSTKVALIGFTSLALP